MAAKPVIAATAMSLMFMMKLRERRIEVDPNRPPLTSTDESPAQIHF